MVAALCFIFIVYILNKLDGINKTAKGKTCSRLYNQGKNTREIAEEARMSFSAIGAILKKAEKENKAQGEQYRKDVYILSSLQAIF